VVLKLKPALQQSEGRSKPWSGSRLVNAFAEKSDGDKVEDFAVMAVPGLVRFANISTLRGPRPSSHGLDALRRRRGHALQHRFNRHGNELARHHSGDNIRHHRRQRDRAGDPDGGTSGYVYSSGTSQSPLNLPAVSDVAYIDGYFVWTVASSDQFIISSLNDGLTYDPLDVATVEGAPDNLVGVRTATGNCSSSASTRSKYGMIAGMRISRSRGRETPSSSAAASTGIRSSSSTTASISSATTGFATASTAISRSASRHNIELKLAQATYFRAFSYTQEGHKFYCLNTDVGSFCYDMATGAWAERISFERSITASAPRSRPIIRPSSGDNATGRLYTPDLDVFDEDGDPMPVIIELPTIEGKRERATMYAFEAYCETGVGNSDVEDPQIIMQYSRDGGRQWSNEMSRSMGKVGNI
jgi:hypothetical protein